MSQSVVILNQAAKGGRAAANAAPYLARLASAARVVHTKHAGHATELARQAAEDGAPAVIAAGGDGTLFEVVNGLMQVDAARRPALGVLPVGTGNSFVKDLGITELNAAVDAILRAEAHPVDVVEVTHRAGIFHYINLLSVGFSAEAGALTNRRYKSLGAGGYILAVLQCLLDLKSRPFPHTLDGATRDERPYTLVSFSNSRYTGGDMKMAPRADIADGQLDVVRIGAMRRLRFLTAFPRIFAGTHDVLDEIDIVRATEVEFASTAPVVVMVDGEIRTLTLRRLAVQHEALRVYR